MELKIVRYLPCMHCGRMFAWKRSRGIHESRCPALKRIPNTIKEYRGTLQWIAKRLKTKAVTEGEGKALAEIILNTLNTH